MKYNNPELQHKLAAEYVVGTLHGAARRRFEKLLAQNEMLRRRVLAWEQRLSPLAASVKEVPVPAHVWQNIQQRLGWNKAQTTKMAAPNILNGWRWWAWGSTAMAALFAVLLVIQPRLVPAPVVSQYHDVAVLSTDKAEAVWIVRLRNNDALEFSGLSSVSVPSSRDLELWAIPAKGAPLSLGVVHVRGGHVAEVALTDALKSRLAQGVALAISLEPVGGSLTGAPTGPVLWSGKLQV
jgi:anti-sigma-K factor RskA